MEPINPQNGRIVEIKEAHKHIQEARRLSLQGKNNGEVWKHIADADYMIGTALAGIKKEYNDSQA